MQVTLIARPSLVALPSEWTPRDDQIQGTDGERLIEAAGRVCYDSTTGKGRSSDEYAKHILDVDHGSVLEHAQYTFHISGVSRCLTHELVRHRVGVAISQRSTRYVDESDCDIVEHSALASLVGDSYQAVNWLVTDAAKSARRAYARAAGEIEADLVARGVEKTHARKQARAAAARYLPQGLETELFWSANVRALRYVIELRGSVHADAEIRALAVALLGIMRQEAPRYFADFTTTPSRDGLGEEATR